jgi:hypothetical protein
MENTVWFLSLPVTNYDRTLTAARQEFCLAELHTIYISRTEQKTKAICVIIITGADETSRYKYLRILSKCIIKNYSHKKMYGYNEA